MKLHQTAGGVLFNTKLDKVYLIYKIDRDEWLLPKGHIDDGESVIEAAKRELYEETGYNKFIILGNSPAYVSDFRFKDNTEVARKKVYFFSAILINGVQEETRQRKLEGLKGEWFDIDEAKSKVTHADIAEAIQKAYEQIQSLSNS